MELELLELGLERLELELEVLELELELELCEALRLFAFVFDVERVVRRAIGVLAVPFPFLAGRTSESPGAFFLFAFFELPRGCVWFDVLISLLYEADKISPGLMALVATT